MPLTRPVTVLVVAPVVVALCPPGDAVTVYLVMAEPPLVAGAVQLTTARPLPATACTELGEPGVADTGRNAMASAQIWGLVLLAPTSLRWTEMGLPELAVKVPRLRYPVLAWLSTLTVLPAASLTMYRALAVELVGMLASTTYRPGASRGDHVAPLSSLAPLKCVQ